jgi:hypothetical protein
MKNKFSDVEFLYPNEFSIDDFVQISPVEPFSEASIDFLNALSKELTKDKSIREYADVATFAFFCRKSNLLHLKSKFSKDGIIRLGRGMIFHIAPSNVPVNFAYSMICGLLSGNSNIIRVPSKKFEQVRIICNAIHKLSLEQKYLSFTSRLALVRYDSQGSSTTFFSSICDVRVIWGGDATIESIRRSSIPPRSFDVTFADRYSLCVINADVYINENETGKIANAFYNDTYLFDQNACTAPHLIVWLGKKENVEAAKTIFWNKLHMLLKLKYQVQSVIAVDKLTAFYNQSVMLEKIKKVNTDDNLIWRVELDSLSKDIDKYRCSSGFFSEYHATSIDELTKIINKKYQTLSYYGIEKEDLINFVTLLGPFGIDRIVPMGKTTDFSLTWDGFNLIETLSRCCEIS